MGTRVEFDDLPREWVAGRPPRVWGRHGLWQVRLRWAAPLAMVVGLVVGRSLGFEVDARAIVETLERRERLGRVDLIARVA